MDDLFERPTLSFAFGGTRTQQARGSELSYQPATTGGRVQSIRYGNQIAIPQDGKWYEILKPEWGESGTRTIHIVPNLAANAGSDSVVAPGFCKIIATSGAVAVDDASALICDIGRGTAVNVTASEAHVYAMFVPVDDTVGIPPFGPIIINAWASDVMTAISNNDELTLTDFAVVGPTASIQLVQPAWSKSLEITGASHVGTTGGAVRYNTTILVEGDDVVGEITLRTLSIGVVTSPNPFTGSVKIPMTHFYGQLQLVNSSATDVATLQMIWRLQH